MRDMGADSGQPAIEHRRPKRGDVVVVREDGWPWGELEMGGRWADPDNIADDTELRARGACLYRNHERQTAHPRDLGTSTRQPQLLSHHQIAELHRIRVANL